MATSEITEDTKLTSTRSIVVRMTITFFIVALVVAYSVGVISGAIVDKSRIDATHFALIMVTIVVAAVLVRPDLLERLKRVKLSSFELEMLEKVKEKQVVQDDLLDGVRLLVPLLFPEAERKHLFNLDRRATAGYRGNHALRSELRRLRSIGLLRMRDGRHVAEIKDGLTVDLSDYVELTSQANRWIRRIRELEEADKAPDGKPKE